MNILNQNSCNQIKLCSMCCNYYQNYRFSYRIRSVKYRKPSPKLSTTQTSLLEQVPKLIRPIRSIIVKATSERISPTSIVSGQLPKDDRAIAAEDFSSQELILPPPRNAKINTATFVKSSFDLESLPKGGYPEIAVVGRSNVGKSSLINMLTGNKKLAVVSKTPGRTRCINHFLINNCWYLVDLPGYGFAMAREEQRLNWHKLVKDYFLKRETLCNVLLLVDITLPVKQIDLDCANWMGEAQLPFTIVFTKADKDAKGSTQEKNVADFKKALAADWEHLPKCIDTSAKKGYGKQKLLNYVSQLREFWKDAQWYEE
eukprot:TRINITY_DN22505_c0_g1_i5.p1 TRINITY_DN22505_c0_g1~~TRINITY_DN22505_c0_g1_i5.p1  ORF type:complete len:315 (-),score=28.29 TRINITY_DN22505_c0_g1_i5:92-1036(-)